MAAKVRYLKTLKKYVLLLLFLCLLLAYIIIQYFTPVIDDSYGIRDNNTKNSTQGATFTKTMELTDLFKNSELRTNILKQKVERLARRMKKTQLIVDNSKSMTIPNYNVHIFYYGWYGNPEVDGKYKHWNHVYLPNWKKDDHRIYPTGSHKPPEDVGSNFYPLLGCYSSKDENVIETHFKLMRDAGIGVVVLSWSPPNITDSPHATLPSFFRAAAKFDLKITLHVEPYKGRNPINLKEHLREFLREYGNNSALYRVRKPLGGKEVPVFYIYDSYLIPAMTWKEVLGVSGNLSIRGGDLDALFIGLLAEPQHRYHIKKSQFDGFYTYFATNSFTYGSTWKNWKSLSKFASHNGLIFIPSVGPGYVDTKVRPWNSANTRPRRHGQYYDVAWRSAITNNANYISITSFNEWHEGTQIEPAIPKRFDDNVYFDYQPDGPYFYMNLTKYWVMEFRKNHI